MKKIPEHFAGKYDFIMFAFKFNLSQPRRKPREMRNYVGEENQNGMTLKKLK